MDATNEASTPAMPRGRMYARDTLPEPPNPTSSVRLITLGGLHLKRGGEDMDALLAHRKRIALLIYLAVEHAGRLCARDTLLAVFWPDATEAQARNALRQALHLLRTHLGNGTVLTRGDGKVMLDPRHLSCDAVDFGLALRQEDWRRAVELYGGDFLDGFHIDGAWPFAEWLDRTRARLRSEAAHCHSRQGLTSLAQGAVQSAIGHLRTAWLLSPWNEVIVRALIRAHLAAGDRAGAIDVLRAFTTELRDAFGTEPLQETVSALHVPFPPGAPSSSLTDEASAAPGFSVRQEPDSRVLQVLKEYLGIRLDTHGLTPR